MDNNLACYKDVQSLFVQGKFMWWGAFQDGHIVELSKYYTNIAHLHSQKNTNIKIIMLNTHMKTEPNPEWKTVRPVFIANCKRILGYIQSNRGKINNKGWIEVYLLYNMQNPDMIFESERYRKTMWDKIEYLAQSMKKDSSLGKSVIIQHMAPQFMSKMKSIIKDQDNPRYNLRPRKPVNYVY
jgi:hypothetical protein